MTSPPSNGAAPPAFATVPWGYKRAEVDSWASWVAALVAHGRNETVRADSAEATLKATLERLEQLRHPPSGGDGGSDGDRVGPPRSAPAADLPRRNAPATPAAADREPGTPPPPGRHDGTPPPPGRHDRDGDRPELARLQVVERTLHEVMTLLHRLVGQDEQGTSPR